MSYISSYVHTAPSKPIKKVVQKNEDVKIITPKNTDQETIRLKIFLFVAILSCIVLAVNL